MKVPANQSSLDQIALLAIVALVYLLLALVTRELAIPPGYAVPVWPAAGWALAAVLLWGRRMLLAVFLVRLFVDSLVLDSGSVGGEAPAAWMIPILFAAAVTLQTWVAARLILTVSGPPWRLDNVRQVLAIVGLGGVGASVVAPTLAEISLFIIGQGDGNGHWGNWITWWAGDMAGVAVITPLVLLAARSWRSGQWRRFGFSATLMLLALLALAVTTHQLIGAQVRQLEQELHHTASHAIDAARLRIERYEIVLHSVQRLIVASEYVEYSEFAAFAGPLVAEHPGIHGIEWLPMVEQGERDAFEARGRELYGSGFQMWMPGQDGPRAVEEMEQYFPVLYVTPLSGNRNMLGQVANAKTARSELVESAWDADGRSVMKRMRCFHNPGNVPSIVFARAVIDGGRHEGFVILTEQLEAITRFMDAAADDVGADLVIRDLNDDKVIHEFNSGTGLADSGLTSGDVFEFSDNLSLGDQQWQATFRVPAAVVTAEIFSGVYLIILTGSFAVSLLAAITLLITGERQAIRRVVTEKTRELELANKRLEELSGTDALTGVANRRGFENELQREWRRALRDKEPLTIALLDLDLFKLLNDSRGHQAGDSCLREVARTIRQSLHRAGDLCGRYGGEEFIIVFSGADTRGAFIVLERIRNAIAALEIPINHDDNSTIQTISIGFAQVYPATTRYDWTHVVHAADVALYQAKHDGRDRVAMSEDISLVGE